LCYSRGYYSASSGVLFSTGDTVGNDNTIEYCLIGDGITTPTNAIYSAGTLWGQIIVILRFQIIIFTIILVLLPHQTVFYRVQPSAWTITNNKFYQTATRTSTGTLIHRAVNIVTASGINY
jgi:hypothetical protein